MDTVKVKPIPPILRVEYRDIELATNDSSKIYDISADLVDQIKRVDLIVPLRLKKVEVEPEFDGNVIKSWTATLYITDAASETDYGIEVTKRIKFTVEVIDNYDITELVSEINNIGDKDEYLKKINTVINYTTRMLGMKLIRRYNKFS